MMKTLMTGEKIACPACGKEQEDPVEDYVIPGRIGDQSTQIHECPWCDAKFSVEHTGQGKYIVEEIL